jgi:hypothetical protein
MIIIKHRVNTIKELKSINKDYGIEIDLRSNKSDIYLHHDPFKNGESFLEWVKFYNHRLLVLNVKEEGLENKIINILKKYNIKNFFFHDQSFSSIIKNMKKTNVSIRYSEFEKIYNRNYLFKFIKWVWIDNFNYIPNDNQFYDFLKKKKVMTCIVSPELVNLSRKKEISIFKKKMNLKKITFNAVCTKIPKLWI